MNVTETGILRPDTFITEWKIQRFFANCLKVGHCYKSPLFPIQYPEKSSKWYLMAYPRSIVEKDKDYVALGLWYDSEDDIAAGTVNFELAIVAKQNGSSVKEKGSNTFSKKSLPRVWNRFIQHTALKDAEKGYLVNDTLTVLCKMTILKSQDVKEEFHAYSEWLNTIKDGLGDYEKLLEGGSFADVTFKVQNKQINAHKAILSCRSQVFKAMFEYEMKEKKQSSVDITDIDHDVMKELFRFLYSGKVKNIEQIASDLLIAADKYQLIELKALCEKTLYDKLTVDNAIDYLKLTDVVDTIHLKTLIIKFVAAHHKDIIIKPGFGDLNSKVMHEIMIVMAETDE